MFKLMLVTHKTNFFKHFTLIICWNFNCRSINPWPPPQSCLNFTVIHHQVDEGSKHPWKVGQFLPDYTAQHTDSHLHTRHRENLKCDQHSTAALVKDTAVRYVKWGYTPRRRQCSQTGWQVPVCSVHTSIPRASSKPQAVIVLLGVAFRHRKSKWRKQRASGAWWDHRDLQPCWDQNNRRSELLMMFIEVPFWILSLCICPPSCSSSLRLLFAIHVS
jgi:hypothetical protein